jgi:hypothetical protein
MDYNPRTAMGIPTEPVGSIPRPLKLQLAYANYDAKKITKALLPIPSGALKRRGRQSSPMANSASRALLPIRLPTPSPAQDRRPILPRRIAARSDVTRA